SLNDGDGLLGHLSVVDRPGEVVVRRRCPGVQAEPEVHDEGLPLLTFLLEDPVMSAGSEAVQRYAVHANHSPRSDRRSYGTGRTTARHRNRIYLRARTAPTLGGCLDTPHTPLVGGGKRLAGGL